MKSRITISLEAAKALFFIVFITLTLGPQLEAGKPKVETLQVWDEYVRLTEQRIDQELRSETGLFAHDSQSAETAEAEGRILSSNEATVVKIHTTDPLGHRISVPGGAIHHWRGTVLTPDTDLETVLESVRNPDKSGPLQEDVLEARVLERGEDSLRVYLKLIRQKIVTVGYNTEHLVRLRRREGQRASSRSIATRIVELQDVNTPDEQEKPPDRDRGFLWRLNSYWKYEQRGDGVLVECESLTLSRDYPSFLKPILGPIISSVARESMLRTLTSMRDRLAGSHFQECSRHRCLKIASSRASQHRFAPIATATGWAGSFHLAFQ